MSFAPDNKRPHKSTRAKPSNRLCPFRTKAVDDILNRIGILEKTDKPREAREIKKPLSRASISPMTKVYRRPAPVSA